MYNGRAADGLENPRPFVDPYAQFDNDILRDNCSDTTVDFAYGIEDKVVNINFKNDDLENQMQYLKDIANWFMDNM